MGTRVEMCGTVAAADGVNLLLINVTIREVQCEFHAMTGEKPEILRSS
jgi:hypothetical protein